MESNFAFAVILHVRRHGTSDEPSRMSSMTIKMEEEMSKFQVGSQIKLVMIIATLGLSSAMSHAALAQSELVVIGEKVNPVIAPKSPVDVFRECANDSICRSAIDAAATYFGVPPGRVSG